MQSIFLECGAVRLEPLTPADLPFVEALHSDQFGNRCMDTAVACVEADAGEIIRAALHTQETLGLTKWKLLTQDNSFLGWAGFTQVSETSEISLNYCLANEALLRDENLPRNVCKALCEWFFENTYFSHLVAIVRTDNRNMRDVMQATGFQHRESKVIDGIQADVFQLLSPSMQSYLMTA